MLPYRIRQTRTQQGLSQGELAEKLNVSRTAVVNWETGYAKPRLETVDRIANALKVSKEWLLDKSNDEYEKMELAILLDKGSSDVISKEISFNELVGARLRYNRKIRGLVLKDVADQLHLSTNTISGYELGNREPNMESLRILAKLYGMSLDNLLDVGNEDSDSNPFRIENEPWIFDILAANDDKKLAIKKVWEVINNL
jgi:transcriptional regulator with XRE-family HTH domain